MGGKLNPVCQEKVAPKRGGRLNCRKEVASNPGHSLANTFHHLQRVVGNQTVQRLIRSESIQAKLTIGAPNDIYEQEADRVAEQITRMSSPLVQRNPQSLNESTINPLNQGGEPLSPSVRNFFEPRFGVDFSGVRIHRNPAAEKSAQSVNALAYTLGNHVVFGHRKYAPHSSKGRRLLAHELTHVIQQTGSSQILHSVSPQIQRFGSPLWWLLAALAGCRDASPESPVPVAVKNGPGFGYIFPGDLAGIPDAVGAWVDILVISSTGDTNDLDAWVEREQLSCMFDLTGSCERFYQSRSGVYRCPAPSGWQLVPEVEPDQHALSQNTIIRIVDEYCDESGNGDGTLSFYQLSICRPAAQTDDNNAEAIPESGFKIIHRIRGQRDGNIDFITEKQPIDCSVGRYSSLAGRGSLNPVMVVVRRESQD